MERAQRQTILKDLDKKLVLLVGPRQCGKTWLARDIAREFKHSIYLNYDQPFDREVMYNQSWLDTTDLLILDELHKMEGWKNYIKGVYDTKPPSMRILVTGSARLSIYDQLGDSLAGRYFRHRLLPISLAELEKVSMPLDINRLMERGGFPEPYLAEDDVGAQRWRLQYINSMLSTDVFEIDKIYNLKAMQMVFNLLRSRVGSPVSYQSLANDVAVSPATIKRYIQVLEALFMVFTVVPYSKNVARSLLKEPKVYFYDTALVQGDDGARFENLVAVSLLKHVYGKVDMEAEAYSLHYLRTKEGKEVDFALVHQDKIETLIEVKLANHELSQSLAYFHEKYNLPAIQLVKSLRHDYSKDGIRIMRAEQYLSELYL